MKSEHHGIRLAAATALARIAPQKASNAVAVLKGLQHDPELARVWSSDGHGGAIMTDKKDYQNPQSVLFRLSASVPLWELQIESEPPVTSILEEMNKIGRSDDVSGIPYIELLGEIGPPARSALPVLKTFLQPQRWVRLRRTVAIAIRKIDPEEYARLGLPGTLVLP